MSAVVISQPMLFPWPGFFEQLMLADIFYFLDDTQYSKGSFTNRIQIKLGEQRKWMTIPLAGKGTFQEIHHLTAHDTDWRGSHLALLHQAFRHAPYRADAIRLVETAYASDTLCKTLIASIELSAQYMGIGKNQETALTSSIAIDGRSWQRVLDIVTAVKGTRYLTGHGAAGYLDHEAFAAAGIDVEYMAYSKTPWPQAGNQFSPYVSILGLIANVGPECASYLHPKTVPWQEFLQTRTAI